MQGPWVFSSETAFSVCYMAFHAESAVLRATTASSAAVGQGIVGGIHGGRLGVQREGGKGCERALVLR